MSDFTRDFIKIMCSLVFGIFVAVAIMAWVDDFPSRTTWYGRIGFPIIAAVAIGVFLKVHYLRDIAPDFLSRSYPRFFDRNGFCFSCSFTKENNVCVLKVLFQNRHERECIAHLAIRRGIGLFRQREKSIRLQIQCPGGAFGKASLRVGFPDSLQGTQQKFEIGVTTTYPKGKGRILRFRDGIAVRHNSEFHISLGRLLMIVGSCGLFSEWLLPAKFTATLPSDVAKTPSLASNPDLQILWTIGQDPSKEMSV
jgi:hypothetical protein